MRQYEYYHAACVSYNFVPCSSDTHLTPARLLCVADAAIAYVPIFQFFFSDTFPLRTVARATLSVLLLYSALFFFRNEAR